MCAVLNYLLIYYFFLILFHDGAYGRRGIMLTVSLSLFYEFYVLSIGFVFINYVFISICIYTAFTSLLPFMYI